MDWVRLYSSGFVLLFAFGFLLFAYWETVRPYRQWSTPPGERWRAHGLLLVVSTVVPTLVLRTSPIALSVALQQQEQPWALLRQPWMPLWAAILLTFVLVDGALYAVHWVEHRVPWLWRIHQLHHSDLEFDVSTATRVHPLDAIVQSLTVSSTVYLLGAPPVGVFVSQFIVLANSFWIHSNIKVPGRVLDVLEHVIMTPRIHQVHHSQLRADNDTNLGDVLVIWDRLFRTYRAQPTVGYEQLRMGLPEMTMEQNLKVGSLLLSPFRRGKPRGASAPARMA